MDSTVKIRKSIISTSLTTDELFIENTKLRERAPTIHELAPNPVKDTDNLSIQYNKEKTTCTWPDDSKYIGEWSNKGMRHGLGTYINNVLFFENIWQKETFCSSKTQQCYLTDELTLEYEGNWT